MSFAQTVLLAAIAGGTIFLGLPIARLRGLSARTQAILATAAGGVILFLIYDILAETVEPVGEALERTRDGAPAGEFAAYATTLAAGVAVGLLSVTYVSQWLGQRSLGAAAGTAAMALSPRDVAVGTAVGLGLHNFSEGLAIGQSAATGATTLALAMVVGFALHNATEGFAIAAPLGRGERPSWGFLAAAGLIGGGPTFAGSLVGYSFVAPVLSILFLALAAGALIFVFNEVMSAARRLAGPMLVGTALTLGLLVALGTDFVLVAAGA
jgi:ZIP family zinc transporter